MLKFIRDSFQFIFKALRGLALILGTLVLLSVAFTFYYLEFPTSEEILDRREIVLVHTFDGGLLETSSENTLADFLKSDSVSLRKLQEVLEHAQKDSKVKGVILRVGQAHLGYAQIQELQSALKKFRKTGKFVLAHADTFGELESGMGSYYLASACDEIMLQPMGSVNITGLGIEVPYIRKLLDDSQIRVRFEGRKEYKSFLETFTRENMSPESYEQTKEVLNSIFETMLHDISVEREIPVPELQQIVDQAPVIDAHKAKQMGLIDHVGYVEEAKKRATDLAKKATLNFMTVSHYASWIDVERPGGDHIAVIYGTGTIKRTVRDHDNPLISGDVMGSEEICAAFEEALKNPKVKAIIFRVNSGGGSPVASETIWYQIKRAQAKGIPVIASMSDYAASGGYWIISHANKIVAHPATITGSIGVGGGKLILQDFWHRWGIHWDKVTVGKNADLASFNFDFTEEQWKKFQESLDYIYDAFITKVSEGRKLSREHVEQIAKGRIWSGSEALKYGLVDKLGGFQEALALAKSEAHLPKDQEVSTVTYPYKKSPLERLLHLAQGGAGRDFLSEAFLQRFSMWASVLERFKILFQWTDQDVLSTPFSQGSFLEK